MSLELVGWRPSYQALNDLAARLVALIRTQDASLSPQRVDQRLVRTQQG
jgi:hypothetical protein